MRDGDTYDEQNHPRRRASDHRSQWHQPVSTLASLVLVSLSLAAAVAAYFGSTAQTTERISLVEQKVDGHAFAIQEIRSSRAAEAQIVSGAIVDLKVLSERIENLTRLLEREERRRR